jgi:hypothetical protein
LIPIIAYTQPVLASAPQVVASAPPVVASERPVVASTPAPIERVAATHAKLFAPMPELPPDDYPARMAKYNDGAASNGQDSGKHSPLESVASIKAKSGAFHPHRDRDSPLAPAPPKAYTPNGVRKENTSGRDGKEDERSVVDTLSVSQSPNRDHRRDAFARPPRAIQPRRQCIMFITFDTSGCIMIVPYWQAQPEPM